MAGKKVNGSSACEDLFNVDAGAFFISSPAQNRACYIILSHPVTGHFRKQFNLKRYSIEYTFAV